MKKTIYKIFFLIYSPLFYLKLYLFRLLNKDIKLIVGGGNTFYKNWLYTDIYILNITSEKNWSKIFRKKEIKAILAEHVLEHLTNTDFEKFLRIVKPYLAKNASIRIAVPDKNHPSKYVKNLVKPGGSDHGSEDHKSFYSHNKFTDIAKKVNYNLVLIEYFDNGGIFKINNKRSIDSDSGYIKRSSKNYRGRFTNSLKEYNKMLLTTPVSKREQFIKNNFSYTSLIADFVNNK
jgi:predicted SAM-dependent methyltransferase